MTPPVASVVVEAVMIGEVATSVVEDDIIEPAEVAADAPDAVLPAAELAEEKLEPPAELEAAPSPDPPCTGSGEPLSGPTPCWACLASRGDQAHVLQVCSANTHSDSVDSGSIIESIQVRNTVVERRSTTVKVHGR